MMTKKNLLNALQKKVIGRLYFIVHFLLLTVKSKKPVVVESKKSF